MVMLCLLLHTLQATLTQPEEGCLVQAHGSSELTHQEHSTTEHRPEMIPAGASSCEPEWVACSAANVKSMLTKQHVILLLAMEKRKNGAPHDCTCSCAVAERVL